MSKKPTKKVDQDEWTSEQQAKVIAMLICFRLGLARTSEITHRQSIWNKNLKHSGKLFISALKTKMEKTIDSYEVWNEYKGLEIEMNKVLKDMESEIVDIIDGKKKEIEAKIAEKVKEIEQNKEESE